MLPDIEKRTTSHAHHSLADAAVFVIAGIVTLLRRRILVGIILIVVGLLIGPGGVSIFH